MLFVDNKDSVFCRDLDQLLCVLQYMCTYVYVFFTVCYFTGILYAVVRKISMLFIDNKDSVFCILYLARPR